MLSWLAGTYRYRIDCLSSARRYMEHLLLDYLTSM